MKKAIIIANERKSQFNSKLPTILHKIIDKPMIEKVVDNFIKLDFNEIVSVVDYEKTRVIDALDNKCDFLEVSEATLDFKAIIPLIKDEEGYTILTFGSVPLITKSTYSKMLDALNDYPMVVLTGNPLEERHQDIIIRNPNKNIRAIVKYEDANADQLAINEVNMNVYAFNNKVLFDALKNLSVKQDDFDATDLVVEIKAMGHSVMPYLIKDPLEALLITSRKDLVVANDWERLRINEYWLNNDVTILDSRSTIIGSDVIIGKDTIIHPNNTILKYTVIGEDNRIYSDNYISNSTIGTHNRIERSKIKESKIGSENVIGPWSNLREDNVIGDNNRIGSYVELKKCVINNHNALAHNVYLGDTTLGDNINIGWGVVSANYDGKVKHKTNIQNNSFIGSSTTIIAPVNIGEYVLVAAGSVINEDVESDAMAIARAPQKNKPNKGKLYIEGEE